MTTLYFSTDVESDGPIPGPNSMLSYGVVAFTEDGNELESSLNHRYRVVEDGKYIWKTVEELKVGDRLVVCLGGHPEKCSNKLPKMENIRSNLTHKINIHVVENKKKPAIEAAGFTIGSASPK